jgi:hypothetical protein
MYYKYDYRIKKNGVNFDANVKKSPVIKGAYVYKISLWRNICPPGAFHPAGMKARPNILAVSELARQPFYYYRAFFLFFCQEML